LFSSGHHSLDCTNGFVTANIVPFFYGLDNAVRPRYDLPAPESQVVLTLKHVVLDLEIFDHEGVKLVGSTSMNLGLFFFGISSLSIAAQMKPSFNCSKARTEVETSICHDETLVALDRELAAVYNESLAMCLEAGDDYDRAALVEEQKDWLTKRSKCISQKGKEGTLVECLIKKYKYRLRKLSFDQTKILRPDKAEAIVTRTKSRLNRLFEHSSRNGDKSLDELACDYFREDPLNAAKSLGAQFGSNLDNFAPMCRSIDIVDNVPDLKSLVELLNKIKGSDNCDDAGSMRYAKYRDQAVLQTLAATYPFPDAKELSDHFSFANSVRPNFERFKHPEEGRPSRNYFSDLKHWSEQGIWERKLFLQYKTLLPVAISKLKSYYMNTFHIADDVALRAAEFYVQAIINSYAGVCGESSFRYYPSFCYESEDVKEFIKTEKLPTKECPDSEWADTSKPTILRRLLGIAIVTGMPKASIEKILKAGANLEPVPEKEKNNDTPLMMAADRTEIIDLLLKAGAKPNFKNSFGKTALMYAIQENNLSGVRALLKAGADPNSATNETDHCIHTGNRSVLMYAAWQSNREIINELIKGKANPLLKDTQGMTAAEYLLQNETLEKGHLAQLKANLSSKSKMSPK
jgi:uncharacterized protein